MKRQPIDHYDGPTTLAIDVSAYQGAIDWPTVARSEAMLGGQSQGRPRLAIVRSSDGVQTRKGSAPDPMAVRNLRGAHEAGLPVAIYHYVRGHHDARAQVELVREVIAVAGVPVAFVALDLEGRPDDKRTPESEADGAWWTPKGETPPDTHKVLRCLEAMTLELETHGHRVVIYTAVAWHWYVAQEGLGDSVDVLARLPLWTPYYTRAGRPLMPVGPTGKPAPWATWTLWQYTAEGRIAGIEGPIDLNRFRGDEAALERWLAIAAKPDTRTAAIRDLEDLRETYADDPAVAHAIDAAIGELARCAPA